MDTEARNTFFNLANLTTVTRIALIPPFIIMVLNGNLLASFLIFLIAGLTDFLDGQFARLLKQKTKIGTTLDPAADKMLMTSAYIVLSFPVLNTLNSIPLWVTTVVVGRDLLMVSGYFAISFLKGPVTIIPSLLGKTSTAFQIGTILLVLLLNYLRMSPPYLYWVYYLTITFTLLSFIQYVSIYAFRKPSTE